MDPVLFRRTAFEPGFLDIRIRVFSLGVNPGRIRVGSTPAGSSTLVVDVDTASTWCPRELNGVILDFAVIFFYLCSNLDNCLILFCGFVTL